MNKLKVIKNRQGVIIVAGIVGTVSIAVGLINVLSWSKPHVVKTNIKDSSEQSTKFDYNVEKTNVEYNVEQTDVEGEYKDNVIVNEKPVESPDFKIVGISRDYFIQYLKNTTKITTSLLSKNVIAITYSGKVSSIAGSEKNFIYRGGHIILKINGRLCKDFESIKIPICRAASRGEVEYNLRQLITTLVEDNKQDVKNAMLDCID